MQLLLNATVRLIMLHSFILLVLSGLMLNAQTDTCHCWDRYGNISDKDLIHTEKLRFLNISFCGWRVKAARDSTLRMSDFTVFQCNNKNILCRYYALDECVIESANDTVNIYEIKWMPTAPDWEWTEIKIRKRVIFEENGVIFSGIAPCPMNFNLSDNFITSTLKALDIYIGNTEYESVSKLIGTLEFLALTGNEAAHKRLFNLETYYHIKTNAATAEHWADAKKIVSWVLETRNL